ncbi:MAG TPA: monovalent cation/H+ antiporter subunit D family protein [Longimicrobiaceae bacterium]|nr:monovalent cation/H+ antiporter subunit D family protein [Longimicrobiaceae bacterium]
MTPQTAMIMALAIPAVAALLIAATGRLPQLREAVTLVAGVLLLLTVGTLVPVVLGGARPALTVVEMLPGVSLEFVLEPLGMLFALTAAILWPIASLYSIGYMRGNGEANQTRFYLFFAVAIFSVMGIAMSGNLLTLFVFYEMLTLSTYPLVTHKGTAEAMRAGRVYLGILIGTSIGLLLPAIIWTWFVAGTVEFTAGGILAGNIAGPALGVLLALFIFGIGKAAVMPVHRWLPAAMVAPTPVSALLHAVAVVKAGVFSVVKVAVYIFGVDLLQASVSTHWLVYIAGVTVVGASLIALRQNNLKRLLAYSTISQLSYIVLAVGIMHPLATMGAALHIIVHAFGKITLFFAAGSIYTASHKTEISQLRGIGRRMPWTMGAFAVAAISMIGLPPAAGFVSKWYMLLGAFEVNQLFAVAVIVISTLLNAAYFVPIVYSAFLRDEDYEEHGPDHGEAPLAIVLALVATAALTVLLFFFPQVPLELAHQLVEIIP